MVRLIALVIAILVFAGDGLAQTSPLPAQESPECTQAKTTVTRLETRLKDWPALARYRDDNANVVAPGKA